MKDVMLTQGLKSAKPRTVWLPFSTDNPPPLFAGDCVIIPGIAYADLSVGETVDVRQTCPAPLDEVKLATAVVVGIACTSAESIMLSHAFNDVRFASADQMTSYRAAKASFMKPRTGESYTAIYLEKVD